MHAHLDLSDTRSPWIRVLRLPEEYDRVNERSTGFCRCQTNVPNGEPASVAGPRMIPHRVIQRILDVDLVLVCLPGSAPNLDRTQVGDCAPLTGLSVTRGGPPSVCRHYTWYLVLGPRLCFEPHQWRGTRTSSTGPRGCGVSLTTLKLFLAAVGQK
jgi:hypothetical protein